MEHTVESSFFLFGQFGVLFTPQGFGVVSLIPLSEWCGIDGNDASLDEGFGTDQLVVGGVIDDINDAYLAGYCFGSP